MKKTIFLWCLLGFVYSVAAIAVTSPLKPPISVSYCASWDAYNGYTPDKIPAANLDVVNY